MGKVMLIPEFNWKIKFVYKNDSFKKYEDFNRLNLLALKL